MRGEQERFEDPNEVQEERKNSIAATGQNVDVDGYNASAAISASIAGIYGCVAAGGNEDAISNGAF